VAGVPLVVHTIRHALAAESVDAVVVTTDDDEIAALAAEHGVEVVHRPAELSGDASTSESALIDALDQRRQRGEPDPEIVVFLQCTSPVRASSDIDDAVRLRDQLDVDTVFSACRDRALYWRVGDAPEAVNYDPAQRAREQDMPAQVRENGSIYVVRTDSLRSTGNRLGGSSAVYEMDALSSFQVDDSADVELVEWALRKVASRAPIEWPSVIDLVVFDFDGVMTDNTVFVAEDGSEAVRCQRADGWGIARLRDADIPMLILSTEEHPVVGARARKLEVPYLQGVDDKRAALIAELDRRGVAAANVVYLGNDVNDLGCFELVGLPIGVADIHPDAFPAVRHVLSRRGGEGAIRELCDLILARR
jgi:YrbI family 3-deoxy-D-manno-octulosonate 8-phosphate phosphatase